MASIVFRGRSYDLAPGETVLECLERHGQPTESSCRSGHCQTCLMRAAEGAVPAAAQQGLKDTDRARGLFLACACRPEASLVIADDAGLQTVTCDVLRKDMVAPDIARLVVEPRQPFAIRPGQFVHVVNRDGVSRPYSVANEPGAALELHVRRMEGGAVSPWIVDALAPGDEVLVRGPFGSCFYPASDPEEPLLLAGVSTGLAPLFGIVRDALHHGHRGPIALYHGASRASGLYLRDALETMAASHDNVSVHFRTLEEDTAGAPTGRLDEVVLADVPEPSGHRFFLCGDPPFVDGLKKKLFLAGASLRTIHADPFAYGRGPAG